VNIEAFRIGVGPAGRLTANRLTVRVPGGIVIIWPSLIISTPVTSLPSATLKILPCSSQAHSGKKPRLAVVFASKTDLHGTSLEKLVCLVSMTGALNVKNICVKPRRISALSRLTKKRVEDVVVVAESVVLDAVMVLVAVVGVVLVPLPVVDVLVSVDELRVVDSDVVEVDTCVSDTMSTKGVSKLLTDQMENLLGLAPVATSSWNRRRVKSLSAEPLTRSATIPLTSSPCCTSTKA
jgi:hypothetical protein